MDKNRRDFIKLFSISTLASLTGTLLPIRFAHSAQLVKNSRSAQLRTSATTEVRLGMVFNLQIFKANPTLFDTAAQVCHSLYNVPDFTAETEKISWIENVSFQEAFGYTSPDYSEVPVVCNNCANPPCLDICPTRAVFKNTDGIVAVDYHRCNGCGLCVSACPYGARKMNVRNPREGLVTINPSYPTRSQGVVENCTFCADRIRRGQTPGCVEATGAIIIGDLNDPDSEISLTLQNLTTIRRKTELGTDPAVYYII